MSSFSEEFDTDFREARRRVFREPDRKKGNGKTASRVGTQGKFVDPGTTAGISRNDFYAYMPTHTYIFRPTGELWPASSVNSRLPTGKGSRTTSRWLDQYKPVEQMTWVPGEPEIIEGRLVSEGGWIERKGSKVFNLYRPPNRLRKSGPADLWKDLLLRLYGADANHIERWLAHRVQRPGEKINHALVLGGAQGVGKDTVLVPVKQAVGPWNFSEVSPRQMLGRFNGFLKSVVCRVSEAHDLGDIDRYAFYDHLKTYITAPPDVLRVDEKNTREYSVPNVLGIIINPQLPP